MNLNFNHLLLFLLISCYYSAVEHSHIEASSASPLATISEEDMDRSSSTPILDFFETSLMMGDTVICQGDPPIILDGIFVNTDGPRPYTFRDVNGNDSLGMINVIVLAPILESDSKEICFGESFLGQTTSGSFRDTVRFVNGCDSLITTYNLTVFRKIDTFYREIVVLCPEQMHVKETPAGPINVFNDPESNKTEEKEFLVYKSLEDCDSIVYSHIIFYKDYMSSIEATVCDEPFLTDDGQELTEAGSHEVVYTSYYGCDSTVIVNLEVGKSTTRDTVFRLCEGQSIMLDGEEKFDGSGTLKFRTLQGCDSLLNYTIELTEMIDTARTICLGECFFLGGLVFKESVDSFIIEDSDENAFCNGSYKLCLTVIDCTIQSDFVSDSLMCSDDKNGRFSFFLVKGNYPFTYKWQYLDSTFEGTLDSLFVPIEAEGLPAGDYPITITDVRNMEEVFIVPIKAPDFWSHTADESDNNGYHISCAGGDDGTLEIFPEGGFPPYTYQWSNGATSQKVTDLEADSIAVTITDTRNCDYQVLFELTEPDSLYIEIDSMKPSCDSLPTGLIEVVFGDGGVEPYEYSIQGIGNSVRGQFKNLAPGNYTLIAMDANGCRQEFPTELPGPDIPELVFNRNEFSELATPIKINVQSNVDLDIVQWSTEDGLSCYDCLTPTATPNETTTYTIIATSFDGCVTSEEITVNIDKRRDVYVPNVFSPNGDGHNDRFTVFGGLEVASVLKLGVYSRWGEMIFNQNNFPANDPSLGWDGTFNGQKVAFGTYIWDAKILFVDGEVIDYYGTVNLK